MVTDIRTITLSAAAVGILDGLAALVNAAVRGISPDRVFQYIASGIFGRTAFEGGAAMVALGILLHFVVAFGASATFVLASRSWTLLNRRPLITGPFYGVAVYFFMGEIVSALSNVTRGPRTLSGTVTGILIHIFFVGLPIALISSKFSKGSQT